MALFQKAVKYPQKAYSGPNTRRRVIVIEEPARLAEFMKRLNILHQGTSLHPLPVKMRFIGVTTSHHGQPLAIYACPFDGCNWREGWVQDQRTGKAVRLWAGYNNGH